MKCAFIISRVTFTGDADRLIIGSPPRPESLMCAGGFIDDRWMVIAVGAYILRNK